MQLRAEFYFPFASQRSRQRPRSNLSSFLPLICIIFFFVCHALIKKGPLLAVSRELDAPRDTLCPPFGWVLDTVSCWSYNVFFFLGRFAIAVPGEVHGQLRAWREYGRLPWKDLVQPAIDLASKGFAISTAVADALSEDMVEKIKEGKGLRWTITIIRNRLSNRLLLLFITIFRVFFLANCAWDFRGVRVGYPFSKYILLGSVWNEP